MRMMIKAGRYQNPAFSLIEIYCPTQSISFFIIKKIRLRKGQGHEELY
jgi:hypothetical protein